MATILLDLTWRVRRVWQDMMSGVGLWQTHGKELRAATGIRELPQQPARWRALSPPTAVNLSMEGDSPPVPQMRMQPLTSWVWDPERKTELSYAEPVRCSVGIRSPSMQWFVTQQILTKTFLLIPLVRFKPYWLFFLFLKHSKPVPACMVWHLLFLCLEYAPCRLPASHHSGPWSNITPSGRPSSTILSKWAPPLHYPLLWLYFFSHIIWYFMKCLFAHGLSFPENYNPARIGLSLLYSPWYPQCFAHSSCPGTIWDWTQEQLIAAMAGWSSRSGGHWGLGWRRGRDRS